MDYVRPRTLDDALSRIAAGGVPLAGGTALVPTIVRDVEEDRTVVDLGRFDDLRRCDWRDGFLHVGAMVSLAHIAKGFESAREYEALAKAAAEVGNPQVRRVATIGGNLALGLPVADLPSALLVLDAVVVHGGGQGEERQPVAQLLEAGLGPGRLITAVLLASVRARRSTFLKYAWRRGSGKTIVNIAGSLLLADGVIREPRLAIGGVARHAARLSGVERMLAGRRYDPRLAEEASRAAAAEAIVEVPFPPGDAYRRRLIEAGIRDILCDLARL